jgi:hypothetical protein
VIVLRKSGRTVMGQGFPMCQVSEQCEERQHTGGAGETRLESSRNIYQADNVALIAERIVETPMEYWICG